MVATNDWQYIKENREDFELKDEDAGVLPISGVTGYLRNKFDPDGSKYGKYLDPAGLFHSGGSSAPDNEASGRMAGILRRDWDNYLQDYQPYDAKLREMVMGDRDNQEAIDRARDTTLASFDASQGALGRDRSRLGLSMAADESKQMKDRSARQRTLSEVGAVNRTRMHMADRDMQMMAGNMAGGGLRDAATNTMRTR